MFVLFNMLVLCVLGAFCFIRCCAYRVIFTGTVVVVPDILALASPGERAECRREASQRKNAAVGTEGVRGLRALGVRDLSYRLAFIANSVQVGHTFVKSVMMGIFLLFVSHDYFFVQISDGRRDNDIRNRKKDAEDDDIQQFTVSS